MEQITLNLYDFQDLDKDLQASILTAHINTQLGENSNIFRCICYEIRDNVYDSYGLRISVRSCMEGGAPYFNFWCYNILTDKFMALLRPRMTTESYMLLESLKASGLRIEIMPASTCQVKISDVRLHIRHNPCDITPQQLFEMVSPHLKGVVLDDITKVVAIATKAILEIEDEVSIHGEKEASDAVGYITDRVKSAKYYFDPFTNVLRGSND